MPSIEHLLETTGWVLADWATGTNLFKRGLETGYPPDLWNVERPDDVTALQASFIEAGSQLVLTNSFGGTAHRLKLHDTQDRVHGLNSGGRRERCRASPIPWPPPLTWLKPVAEYRQSLHTARVFAGQPQPWQVCHVSRLAVSD